MANRLIPLTVLQTNQIPYTLPQVHNLEADSIKLACVVGGQTRVQWTKKTLNADNQVWVVSETLADIIALNVGYSTDVPLLIVEITDFEGVAINSAIINTWLCDNLRTFVDSKSRTVTSIQYPITTSTLAQLVTVLGTEADLRVITPSGTGGIMAIQPITTVDGTLTYNLMDGVTGQPISGTLYSVNFGNNALQPPSAGADAGWSQSGSQITFTGAVDQVVVVTGFYIP